MPEVNSTTALVPYNPRFHRLSSFLFDCAQERMMLAAERMSREFESTMKEVRRANAVIAEWKGEMEGMAQTAERNFHQKTAYEMATELQALINAQPVTQFSDLQEGVDYHYKNGSGESIVTVKRMLPSRKMADVLFLRDTNPRRITPSKYYGTFRPLSDELKSYINVTHESVIDEAIRRRLEIPARVRVHYPEKFVELPERFGVERLRKVIKPQWGQFVTAESLAAMIEERHGSIRKMDLELPKVAAMNPAHVQDYERYIASYNADLDFFRWLQPHIAEGGVFYIEKGTRI